MCPGPKSASDFIHRCTYSITPDPGHHIFSPDWLDFEFSGFIAVRLACERWGGVRVGAKKRRDVPAS